MRRSEEQSYPNAFAGFSAQIRLIAIYDKGVKDVLNAAEKKVLKNLNKICRKHDGQNIVCRFGFDLCITHTLALPIVPASLSRITPPELSCLWPVP
jgi:hypothetical protein